MTKLQQVQRELERALLSLRVIHTWANVDDTVYRHQQDRRAAMRDIANKAAEGLGREDLITRKRK